MLINTKTLSEQIYQVLREDILTQKIKSGQKLTLKWLKERFNVSHTPIREALTHLVDDNLVTYNPNIGATVRTFTSQDIEEIFNFGGELDCIALQYSFAKNREQLLLDLEQICTKASKYLVDKDLSQWKFYSDQFHLVFYKYSNNRWLEQSAKKIRAQITLLSNMYQINSNLQKIHEDHVSIYNLLQEGRVLDATQAMREHNLRDLDYAIEAVDSQKSMDKI